MCHDLLVLFVTLHSSGNEPKQALSYGAPKKVEENIKAPNMRHATS
jgi:hypothetical protein